MSSEKKLQINTETLAGASSCPKDKCCLTNPDNLCPVISDISDDLIYVSNKKLTSCCYHVRFGYNGFCNCPVRKEIYKRYNK